MEGIGTKTLLDWVKKKMMNETAISQSYSIKGNSELRQLLQICV